MKRKIMTGIIALIITLTVPNSVNAFSDVSESDWYHDTVIEMVDRNIVTGYLDNTFKPSGNVTRGEGYKIISELAGLDVFQLDDSIKGNFHWSYPYSIAITDNNIGTVKTTYDGHMNRLEAAQHMIGYINHIIENDIASEFNVVPGKKSYFKDIHGEAADFLYESGIIKGIEKDDGVWFEGSKNVTRAEFISIFKRAETVARIISSDDLKYSIIRDSRDISIDIDNRTRDPKDVEDFVSAIIYMKHHNHESILFKYTEENRDFVMDGDKIRDSYIDTVLEAYEIVRDLYPEYFVRENTFYIHRMPMASEGLIMRFQTGGNIVQIQQTRTKREEFDKETMRIAKEMIDEEFITEEMTQKEIAMQLNEWTVDKLKYDYSYGSMSFTGYGALFEDEAVCLGYTSLYNRMLTLFGIDAVGISGKAGRELHIWTEATLDGEMYYIDTTWNDSAASKSKYFTTSERVFKKGRSWDKDLYEKYRHLID